MNRSAAWRPATPQDLDAVMAIQGVVHALLPERREVMAEKLRLCPEGCRILALGGEVIGYGLSHPWRLGAVPALDAPLGAIPADADCFHLHDVALLPGARGEGAGRAFVNHVRAEARRRGIAALALVSVHGTVPLWGRLGFAMRDLPGLAAKLGPYGADARYMVSDLGGPG